MDALMARIADRAPLTLEEVCLCLYVLLEEWLDFDEERSEANSEIPPESAFAACPVIRSEIDWILEQAKPVVGSEERRAHARQVYQQLHEMYHTEGPKQ